MWTKLSVVYLQVYEQAENRWAPPCRCFLLHVLLARWAARPLRHIVHHLLFIHVEGGDWRKTSRIKRIKRVKSSLCNLSKQRIKTEVDENTQIVTEALLRMLANIAEHVIFIFLGITVVEEFLVDFQAHWNTGLFLFTLVSVLVFRQLIYIRLRIN